MRFFLSLRLFRLKGWTPNRGVRDEVAPHLQCLPRQHRDRGPGNAPPLNHHFHTRISDLMVSIYNNSLQKLPTFVPAPGHWKPFVVLSQYLEWVQRPSQLFCRC